MKQRSIKKDTTTKMGSRLITTKRKVELKMDIMMITQKDTKISMEAISTTRMRKNMKRKQEKRADQSMVRFN